MQSGVVQFRCYWDVLCRISSDISYIEREEIHGLAADRSHVKHWRRQIECESTIALATNLSAEYSDCNMLIRHTLKRLITPVLQILT